MLSPPPRALPENEAFVFVGERKSPRASVPPRMAARMLAMRNTHGKPNADVLRHFAGAADPGRPGDHWQVDFPAGLTEYEASLYSQPFHHLDRAVRLKRGSWWINPHADRALRAALAKRERYLATPRRAARPEFRWIDSESVPDDSLLVVARDDDFTHGILTSRFAVWWWTAVAPGHDAVLAVKSYPFPWPPATTLGALTAVQEAQRHAIARAARSPDTGELDAAVAAAYDWPAGLAEGEAVGRLAELNRRRTA